MRRDTTVGRLAAAGFALAVYLALSLIYFGSTGDYARMYLGYGGDPTAYIWFLNWWPWAIMHGQNPFISHYVWYPEGFNLTWAGSMPTGALLIFPVTWLANAVVSFNVLSLLAPVLSAWMAFLLVRYLTRDTTASIIGGYLFGFSSYEVAKMLGHLNLNLTFVLPLFVLLVAMRFRGDLSRLRFVAAVAIALLAQLGLSTEILASACTFGAIAWLIFLIFAGSGERRRLWMIAGEIALATGTMAILGAPFLFFVLTGLGKIPPQINSPEYFSTDLLNYFIPTAVTRFGSTFSADIVRRFTGNVSEQLAYLGLPVILILLLQVRDLSRRPYVKPLLVTLLVIAALSLGPSLHVGGVATGVWLPWRLALHLPFIHQALPARFSIYTALVAAVIVALWLSAARRGWNRAVRFTLAALACLCLAPNRALVFWTPVALEPFFEPQNVVAALGQDANVIMLPYSSRGQGMIWQWQSGMGFTQSGGYVGSVPRSESLWPVVGNFFSGTGGPRFQNDLSAYCVTHHVSAILIGPGTPDALTAAIDALHWPETQNHGIRIVHVPDPDSLPFYYILGDFWPEEGPENWMGHQINIVTHGRPLELQIFGRYRPAQLGPVEVSVANGSDVLHYQIGQQDTQRFRVPANASVVVTANTTFVPAQIVGSADPRPLSVEFRLLPDAESSEVE